MARRIEIFSAGCPVCQAVVVDGRVLGCYRDAGPQEEELVAAGVGPAASVRRLAVRALS